MAENIDNLISRQAAIDAVEESRRLNHHEDGKEACAHEYEHRHFLKILRDLPTIEPQIIRCNECKWNRTENRKETKQWLPCRAIVTPDDFSCIYAEGKANG